MYPSVAVKVAGTFIYYNYLMLSRAFTSAFIFAVLLSLAVYIEASDNYTVNYNTNQSITAFSTCKKVTNGSATGLSVYVPTQSSAEWTSFYGNPPSGVTIASCGPATTQVIVLTSGSSWTVPYDWNSLNNSIEVIGGGGNGAAGVTSFTRGYGGGGAAYSAISNVTLTPGTAVAYSVGGAGGDSYFCNSTSNCTSIASSAVLAGAKGGVSNVGGSAGAGIGTVEYSGGNGGAQINNGGGGGGGGGGAAGPHGNGAAGGTNTAGWGGAGGGGANGGTAGVSGSSFTGGAGGSKRAASQTGGGGGNGSKYAYQIPGDPGTQDVVWTQTSNGATAGSGGGGGGGGLGGSRGTSAGAPGGSSSAYGGGGGGGGGAINGPPGGAGGSGVQGIIVITYGP